MPSLLDWSSDVCSRSEEHTSELQSRQYIVCRLLLEKIYQQLAPQKPVLYLSFSPTCPPGQGFYQSHRREECSLSLRHADAINEFFFFKQGGTLRFFPSSPSRQFRF